MSAPRGKEARECRCLHFTWGSTTEEARRERESVLPDEGRHDGQLPAVAVSTRDNKVSRTEASSQLSSVQHSSTCSYNDMSLLFSETTGLRKKDGSDLAKYRVFSLFRFFASHILFNVG